MKNFKTFRYSRYTGTIRTVPENYWIASVKDNKIVFNSWDGAIKGRVNKFKIRLLWKLGRIKEYTGCSPCEIEEIKKLNNVK